MYVVYHPRTSIISELILLFMPNLIIFSNFVKKKSFVTLYVSQFMYIYSIMMDIKHLVRYIIFINFADIICEYIYKEIKNSVN